MTKSIQFKVYETSVDNTEPDYPVMNATLVSTDFLPPVGIKMVSTIEMKEGEVWRLDFTKEETK